MKSKLSQKELEEKKRKLLDYKKQLEKNLSKVSKKSKEGSEPSFPQYGDEEGDNILEMEDFAENVSIENKLEHLLSKTKKALKRIDEGSYGVCQECEKPIKKGRLDIYPIADRCVKCAKKHQKQGFWRKVWPFGK